MSVVYYYTRTGNCKKLAENVATQIKGECREITEEKDYRGVWGYLKAGYFAMRKKAGKAEYKRPEEGERVYLCFPIWAGTFPPAVRSFIQQVGRERIVAIASSKASLLKDREGFVQVMDAPKEQTDIQLPETEA